MRFLLPNLTAPAWDFASADPSSNHMAAACGLPTTPRTAQAFTSLSPKSRHMSDPGGAPTAAARTVVGAYHDSGPAMAYGIFAVFLALWVIKVTGKPFVER